MAPLKLTHLFLSFRSLGGVESVLHHHYDQDHEIGIASDFAIYFESESKPIERVFFLGFGANSTIRKARSKLRQVFAATQPTVALYHCMWGMSYLADLDSAARRILMIHGATPGMEEQLRFRSPWVDGIMIVSEALRGTVRQCAPQLDDSRVKLVPYPISGPRPIRPRAPLANRPIVLGFCGRLSFEQKRIDRLPELCKRLDRSGLSYRMEFLGDGQDRPWLESQLADRSRFIFHGRRSGEEYWRTLGGWDAIVFTSDYEGTPIALLEALSVGVIPVYPIIGTGGEGYTEQVLPDLLYRPDDFDHVAQSLAKLVHLPEAELNALRRKCQESVAPHLGDSYLRQFAAFVRSIVAMPRIAQNNFPSRSFLVDHCSFALVERLSAVRRSLRWRLRQ
jgi:glycosyltransferase involved in cell wall biosynthesis